MQIEKAFDNDEYPKIITVVCGLYRVRVITVISFQTEPSCMEYTGACIIKSCYAFIILYKGNIFILP